MAFVRRKWENPGNISQGLSWGSNLEHIKYILEILPLELTCFIIAKWKAHVEQTKKADNHRLFIKHEAIWLFNNNVTNVEGI